jgi:predicted PurR-regulated permease PerM
METQSSLLKITARLVLATLIVLVLVIGKSFLVPFAWSLLIALSSIKLIEVTEEKTNMPRGLIIFLFLLFILLVMISIGYFFYIELHRIFTDMPAISAKVTERLHDLSLSVKRWGITIPDHVDKSLINGWVEKHNDLIYNTVSAIGLNVWDIILILFYLFFLLFYKDLVPQFFTAHVKNKRNLVTLRDHVQKSLTLVRSYIYGMMILTLVSAFMNYLVFLIFGLKFAIFFAVFLAIMNLIPFVGNLMGLAVIMLFAFITKDNMLIPLLIFISLFLVNFLQDNVVRPWLIGDKLKINAFTVFVAIIIGGMIWGVSGMILFIPFVGILKIILENNPKLAPYAIFFSEAPKNPKPKNNENEAENNE